MSEQISEAAWERAIDKRLAMDTVFVKFTDECRLYRLGDDEYDVRPEEALAAQAEIDRENEVTDAEIKILSDRYLSGNLIFGNGEELVRWIIADYEVAKKSAVR